MAKQQILDKKALESVETAKKVEEEAQTKELPKNL